MNVSGLRKVLAILEAEGKGEWPVTTNEAGTKFGEVCAVSERTGAIALLQNSAIAPTVTPGADPVILATGENPPAWDLRDGPEPKIGSWYAECCLLDLCRIETYQKLADLHERLAEDGLGGLMIFDSLSDALWHLQNDLPADDEREAFVRLGLPPPRLPEPPPAPPPSLLDGLMPGPCPSCGSTSHGALDKSGGAYWVRCLKCPAGTFAPTVEEALAQWEAARRSGMPSGMIPIIHYACGKPAFWATERPILGAAVGLSKLRLANGNLPALGVKMVCASCGSPHTLAEVEPKGGFAPPRAPSYPPGSDRAP